MRNTIIVLSSVLLPPGACRKRALDLPGIVPERDLHGAVPEENVDLFTGSLTLKFKDIHLPGPNGFDLTLRRVYNSKVYSDWIWNPTNPYQPLYYTNPAYDWLGLGWTKHMEKVQSLSHSYIQRFPNPVLHPNHPVNFQRCKKGMCLQYTIHVNEHRSQCMLKLSELCTIK